VRIETLTGPHVPRLLEEARELLGADARVVSVRRVGTGARAEFRVVVTEARSAETPAVAAAPARRLIGSGPRVIALVGPTGAGKTTTIAKLANHPRVFGAQCVGLVCLDTFRVGAVEQSRFYAEIARLPLEVVYEKREMSAAMHRLRRCDVVLIDTAGRGPHATGDLEATRQQLEAASPHEIHLVLPAGLHPARARRILADHHARGVTHVLVTKLDEFPGDHGLFRMAREFGYPSRWISDGQDVPGDLRLVKSDWPLDAEASHRRMARERQVSA
jgi:flagellar biosynthesis protein FlhF